MTTVHSEMADYRRYAYGSTVSVRMSRRRNIARRMRNARIGKYSFLAAAALVTLIRPEVTAQFHGHFAGLTYVWSVALLVGSLSSLGGVMKRSWIGEFIGLWGVFIPLIAFAISCFLWHHGTFWIALGLLVLGFACSAIARCQEVSQQKRLAEHFQRMREGRPGL